MSKSSEQFQKNLEEAAPDLYNACKAMHKALFLADDPIRQNTILQEYKALGRAIAKVEGR